MFGPWFRAWNRSLHPAKDLTWGMQDLENNNGGNSGYHTLTFGPYDVSGFDEGSISFDYFTVNYLVGTDKIGYVLLIDGQSAPNLAADDSSLTFLSESTGGVLDVRLRIL